MASLFRSDRDGLVCPHFSVTRSQLPGSNYPPTHTRSLNASLLCLLLHQRRDQGLDVEVGVVEV